MRQLTDSIGSGAGFEESEAIVVRLKEGDETAFAEVFHLYKDLVFNLCFHMLADKSEAMDVTQDVFLTLFRKIHQFRGESSLKTWLYRIAIHQASNRNRWWHRRRCDRTLSLNLSGSEDGQPLINPAADGIPADRHVFSQEMNEALQKGLADLSCEQRAAVILRDVDGLSYEEIAEVLGLQVGTVKSRIARGREKLREVLRPYWGKGDS